MVVELARDRRNGCWSGCAAAKTLPRSLAAESIDPSASRRRTARPDCHLDVAAGSASALRGLNAGQMTPIVQIPTGFAFIRVEHDSNQLATTRPLSQALLATGSVKYVHRRRRLARSGNGSSRVPEAGNLESGSADDLPDAPRFARGRPTALRRLLFAADGSDSKHAHAVRADAGAPRPGATARVRRRPGARAAAFPGGLAGRDRAACRTRGRWWKRCSAWRTFTRPKWTTACIARPASCA